MKINLEGDRYAGIDKDAMDLLKKMLLADPKQRLTASEALNHTYFFEEIKKREELQKSPCLTSASGFKNKHYEIKK
jgi:serine/threonine protein kinase